MDQNAIKNLLPHRDDMLLLDEANLAGETAYGKYHVRGDEWFLRGHFPDSPIVPGVILCEILAQSACVLLSDTMTDGKLPMYTGLNNVRFTNPVRPGDTVETECILKRAKRPFYFAEGKGYANGKLCVKAEFSFAITGE